jgi:MarR family 2-MHQ and catechol resistance regulon transcriptional repressor
VNVSRLHGITEQGEQAIYGLACSFSLIEHRISGYLRKFGLTPAKFNSMMVIKHLGGKTGLSQKDIGRMLIVTPSNTARLIERMETEGMVERLPKAGDRRVNLVRISDKGSRMLDEAWPGYHERINGIVGLLDGEELRQMAAVTAKLCLKLEGR